MRRQACPLEEGERQSIPRSQAPSSTINWILGAHIQASQPRARADHPSSQCPRNHILEVNILKVKLNIRARPHTLRTSRYHCRRTLRRKESTHRNTEAQSHSRLAIPSLQMASRRCTRLQKCQRPIMSELMVLAWVVGGIGFEVRQRSVTSDMENNVVDTDWMGLGSFGLVVRDFRCQRVIFKDRCLGLICS